MKRIIVVLIVGLLLTGCGYVENNVTPKPTKEEKSDLENDLKQEAQVAEEKHIEIEYIGDAILTNENFADVIEEFLCIRNEDEIVKLQALPLSEDFFNQCVADFPYIENIEDMKRFELGIWGMNEEGEWMCICKFSPIDAEHANIRYNEAHDTYYITMNVKNNQIDSINIRLVERVNEL